MLVGFISVLVLVVGFLAGINYLTNSTHPQTPSIGGGPPSADEFDRTTVPANQMEEQMIIVRHSADGFDPPIITIRSGQTIQWINDDASGMWIASDPHPEHIEYPGLDESHGVAQGETYEFAFAKAGVWGYHNHLNPEKIGKVVVL